MTEAIDRQATAGEQTPEAEPTFCRTCPTWASCVAICDELEAYLRKTCDAQVSVRAITFSDLGVPPDGLPSNQDHRLRGGIP